MSLQARPIPPIPGLTAKIARRAFRKGNVYMQSATWFSGGFVMTTGAILLVGHWQPVDSMLEDGDELLFPSRF